MINSFIVKTCMASNAQRRKTKKFIFISKKAIQRYNSIRTVPLVLEDLCYLFTTKEIRKTTYGYFGKPEHEVVIVAGVKVYTHKAHHNYATDLLKKGRIDSLCPQAPWSMRTLIPRQSTCIRPRQIQSMLHLRRSTPRKLRD